MSSASAGCGTSLRRSRIPARLGRRDGHRQHPSSAESGSHGGSCRRTRCRCGLAVTWCRPENSVGRGLGADGPGDDAGGALAAVNRLAGARPEGVSFHRSSTRRGFDLRAAGQGGWGPLIRPRTGPAGLVLLASRLPRLVEETIRHVAHPASTLQPYRLLAQPPAQVRWTGRRCCRSGPGRSGCSRPCWSDPFYYLRGRT